MAVFESKEESTISIEERVPVIQAAVSAVFNSNVHSSMVALLLATTMVPAPE